MLSGLRVGGTTVIPVEPEAVTGAYVQPLPFVNVTFAPFATELPPRKRRLGRAVYSIVLAPDAPATLPIVQVSVVVPLALCVTRPWGGTAPSSVEWRWV